MQGLNKRWILDRLHEVKAGEGDLDVVIERLEAYLAERQAMCTAECRIWPCVHREYDKDMIGKPYCYKPTAMQI